MDDVRDFLSMDYEEPVTYGGMRYRCAEAAYQAQRLSSDADRRMFRLLDGPTARRTADMMDAKRSDWSDVKDRIRREILDARFSEGSPSHERLLSLPELPADIDDGMRIALESIRRAGGTVPAKETPTVSHVAADGQAIVTVVRSSLDAEGFRTGDSYGYPDFCRRLKAYCAALPEGVKDSIGFDIEAVMEDGTSAKAFFHYVPHRDAAPFSVSQTKDAADSLTSAEYADDYHRGQAEKRGIEDAMKVFNRAEELRWKDFRVRDGYYGGMRENGYACPVAISRSMPKGLEGKIPQMTALSPSWETLNAYRDGKISIDEYVARFSSELASHGKRPLGEYEAEAELRRVFLERLGDIAGEGREVSLMCWEKPGDFCHRHIVSDWLGGKGLDEIRRDYGMDARNAGDEGGRDEDAADGKDDAPERTETADDGSPALSLEGETGREPDMGKPVFRFVTFEEATPEDIGKGVAISRSVPSRMQAVAKIEDLAPSWDILNDRRNGKLDDFGFLVRYCREKEQEFGDDENARRDAVLGMMRERSGGDGAVTLLNWDRDEAKLQNGVLATWLGGEGFENIGSDILFKNRERIHDALSKEVQDMVDRLHSVFDFDRAVVKGDFIRFERDGRDEEPARMSLNSLFLLYGRKDMLSSWNMGGAAFTALRFLGDGQYTPSTRDAGILHDGLEGTLKGLRDSGAQVRDILLVGDALCEGEERTLSLHMRNDGRCPVHETITTPPVKWSLLSDIPADAAFFRQDTSTFRLPDPMKMKDDGTVVLEPSIWPCWFLASDRDLEKTKPAESEETRPGDEEPVTSFTGPYAFLSNMAEGIEDPRGGRMLKVPFYFRNRRYLTAESAYQAMRCRDDAAARVFATLNGYDARKAAKDGQYRIRENWDRARMPIMRDILRAKFYIGGDGRPSPYAGLLEKTGNRQLIMDNSWNDRFWGVDEKTGEGRNILGRMLMEVRAENRQKMRQALDERTSGAKAAPDSEGKDAQAADARRLTEDQQAQADRIAADGGPITDLGGKDYLFLSNYVGRVELDGIRFDNAEAAWLAQGIADPARRGEFSNLKAAEARRLFESMEHKSGWDGLREAELERVLRRKFWPGGTYAQLLDATGDRPISNRYRDGDGGDVLGRVLMRIREENRDIESGRRREAVPAKDEIRGFRNEWYFLSNVATSRFEFQGIRYNSAYAAMKSLQTLDKDLRRSFENADIQKAKELSASITPYPGWKERERDALRAVLKAKFKVDRNGQGNFARLLDQTGDRRLVDADENGRPYSGNMLGEVLMEIRADNRRYMEKHGIADDGKAVSTKKDTVSHADEGNDGEEMPEVVFAAVGSRDIDRNSKEAKAFIDAVSRLSSMDGKVFSLTLRSGGAKGCDTYAEESFRGRLERILPMAGFNGHDGSDGIVFTRDDEAERLLSRKNVHPIGDRIVGQPRYEKKRPYLLRDIQQVIGPLHEDGTRGRRSDMVICLTKDGIYTGGTATTVAAAVDQGVPVFNMADDEDRKALDGVLSMMEEGRMPDFDTIAAGQRKRLESLLAEGRRIQEERFRSSKGSSEKGGRE